MKAAIILLVLCWLPFVSNAQTDTIPKRLKFGSLESIDKGLYFGVQIAPFIASALQHKIPYDTATKLFVSPNRSRYTMIHANQPAIYLNAKVVVCNWLTIDFYNSIRSYKGIVTFSEYRSRGGLNFFGSSSYIAQVKDYSLNIITNNFMINPNITFNIKNFNFFVGGGYGKSAILSRTGSLDRKYSFNNSSELYQVNIGYSFKIGKGIFSSTIAHNWSGEMAKNNLNAYQHSTFASFGYALPIFTFKKQPKTPTL